MKFLLVLTLITAIGFSSVSCGLYCWLCAGGVGTSFKDCDSRRVVQNCSEPKYQETGKGPLNRCAYFSFYSLKDKKRIYAKSCTFASYCTESGDVFCKNVRSGAKHCQVQCCDNDKCNEDTQFKVVKTWPTPTPDPTKNNNTNTMWCDWKESDADNRAHNIVSSFYILMAAWSYITFIIG